MVEKKDQYEAEHERIRFRRESLELEKDRVDGASLPTWGLALSGGGIRSATFCLGVLQALARARHPNAMKQTPKDDFRSHLLPYFDYLSTVSGGGYIGAFFSSLFQPDRLRDQKLPIPATSTPLELDALYQTKARKAAEDAYEVLRFEPPGSISTHTEYEAKPVGNGPSAWLRENGRYLTPTGSGDMFYALAMTWRNWLSLHFVIGMPLVVILSFATLASQVFGPWFFSLPLFAALLLLLPLIMAYWLANPINALDDLPARENSLAKATEMMGKVVGVAAFVAFLAESHGIALFFAAAYMVVRLSILIFAHLLKKLAKLSHNNDDDGLNANSVRNYRIHITRYLSTAIISTAALGAVILVVALADELYRLDGTWTVSSAGVLPVLIWLVRRVAWSKDEKILPDWFLKLPLDTLAMIGGVLMALVLCLVWALFVQWIAWDGQHAKTGPFDGIAWRLSGLFFLSAALTVVSSQFIGFLNGSSFQGFYSSRLARAYLGASNGQRFYSTEDQRKKRMSVAETLSKDDISLEDYYATRTAGPLHLINVTVNLTVDPAEQLVQRDRKGNPLCVAPYLFPDENVAKKQSVSFIYNGERKHRDINNLWNSEITRSLTLGQWIGTSGAAFTTGLGRATSLGLSLVLGISNVRLGTWWPANFTENENTPYVRKDPDFAQYLPTQTYFFYEFTGHYHGHRRDFMYLSDGGHFDNTAAYELLRKDRKIDLIVLCDCGCDPTYQFDDLTNLIRLARIDQSLEIKEDTGVLTNSTLANVFGSIGEFKNPPEADSSKCALLFNVFRRAEPNLPNDKLEHVSRILVIKPRLISSLAADVFNYARVNPDFPNQTTADQFFDEAQFESYRQLGLSIGQKIFGDGSNERTAKALWKYLKNL